MMSSQPTAPHSTEASWWASLTTPDNVASLFTGLCVVLLGAWLALHKYSRERDHDRRLARAETYARALQAVRDYVELPYGVIRREDTPANNTQISTRISETQARLDFLRSWILIQAPRSIGEAYDELVATTREEVGAQISEAWQSPARNAAAHMPIGEKLATPKYETVLADIRDLMRADLNSGRPRARRAK